MRMTPMQIALIALAVTGATLAMVLVAAVSWIWDLRADLRTQRRLHQEADAWSTRYQELAEAAIARAEHVEARHRHLQQLYALRTQQLLHLSAPTVATIAEWRRSR